PRTMGRGKCARLTFEIAMFQACNPDVYESRMEKRSEVKNQPVWHSKQGEFVRCVEEKARLIFCFPWRRCMGFNDVTLDLILNLEMVKEKTAEEIKQIWKQYYSAKDTFYAVIPVSSPCCPLPLREGYEFFMGQWVGTELHYTALINVQTRGEGAGSQLILYHYLELQKEKGIVLMTAEMDTSFLNVVEAHCLANQVKLFYATDRPELYDLVETFNHRPSEFKYMAVIAELEQNGIGKELRPDGDFENV
uniref:ATP synthase mitochondrial F1 complex assembly factor 1 n=1 Tax=Sphenodon punctatus TaxID=8508 RepID=A0A8D0L6E2_SPHPU